MKDHEKEDSAVDRTHSDTDNCLRMPLYKQSV